MTPIQININGTWIQESIPELHALLKRPLPDGLGVFETMRMVDNTIPLLSSHYQRLQHSATALNFRLPDLPGPEQILDGIKEQLFDESNLLNAKVRWGIVYQSERLQQETAFTPPLWFLEVIPGPAYSEFDTRPLHLGVYSEKRKQSGTSAIHKLLHEALYDEAYALALSEGWDDAFILNTSGKIIESVNSNLFVWDGTHLRTPPLSEGCVGGIYRNHLMEVCKQAGIRVQESALNKEDLELAKEIMLCNALRGVRAVTHFAGKQFSSEFSSKLYAMCRTAERP